MSSSRPPQDSPSISRRSLGIRILSVFLLLTSLGLCWGIFQSAQTLRELQSRYQAGRDFLEFTRQSSAPDGQTLLGELEKLDRLGYKPEALSALRNNPEQAFQSDSSPLAKFTEEQRSLRRQQIPQQESLLQLELGSLALVLIGALALRLLTLLRRRPPQEGLQAGPLSFTDLALETQKETPSETLSARGYTERVLTSLSNFLTLTARDGSIQMVNPALCQSLGYKQSELLGKSFSQVIAPDYPEGETLLGHLETSYLCRDGSSVPVLATFSAVTAEDGSVDGLVIVAQDISERQEAENALREREKKLHSLTERLVSAQESERQRVARDLHDGMLQSVIAAELQLSSFLRRLKKQELDIDTKAIKEGTNLLHEAVSQGRQLINDLRPPTLDKFGLERSLRQEVEKLARQLGCESQLQCQGDLSELPQQLETALFRICQESFHNIRKHASPKLVRVELQRSTQHLTLTIIDDGQGFDIEQSSQGVGLHSMRERAELLGGSLSVQSQPGEGTQVVAKVPSVL